MATKKSKQIAPKRNAKPTSQRKAPQRKAPQRTPQLAEQAEQSDPTELTDLSSVAHRPKGSRNIPRDEVICEPSRCKRCGSTNRTKYLGNPVVQSALGKDVHGHTFTHMIARRTACANCGQARRDISFMNDVNISATDLQTELTAE